MAKKSTPPRPRSKPAKPSGGKKTLTAAEKKRVAAYAAKLTGGRRRPTPAERELARRRFAKKTPSKSTPKLDKARAKNAIRMGQAKGGVAESIRKMNKLEAEAEIMRRRLFRQGISSSRLNKLRKKATKGEGNAIPKSKKKRG